MLSILKTRKRGNNGRSSTRGTAGVSQNGDFYSIRLYDYLPSNTADMRLSMTLVTRRLRRDTRRRRGLPAAKARNGYETNLRHHPPFELAIMGPAILGNTASQKRPGQLLHGREGGNKPGQPRQAHSSKKRTDPPPSFLFRRAGVRRFPPLLSPDATLASESKAPCATKSPCPSSPSTR